VPVGGYDLVEVGLLGPVALITVLRAIATVVGVGGLGHDQPANASARPNLHPYDFR